MQFICIWERGCGRVWVAMMTSRPGSGSRHEEWRRTLRYSFVESISSYPFDLLPYWNFAQKAFNCKTMELNRVMAKNKAPSPATNNDDASGKGQGDRGLSMTIDTDTCTIPKFTIATITGRCRLPIDLDLNSEMEGIVQDETCNRIACW